MDQHFERATKKTRGQEILEKDPKFEFQVLLNSAIFYYTKKLYALGLVDVNKDGKYKGHVNNTDLTFWHDYMPSIYPGYITMLRQIELQLNGKLDEYIGGRNEANYDAEREHYILYETRELKEGQDMAGLHSDSSTSKYLYEVGKRNVGRIDTPEASGDDYALGQAKELFESLRIPQGSIIKQFYLKYARGCPLDEFIKTCQEAHLINKEIAALDQSDQKQMMQYFESWSFQSFTAAADMLDKDKYDFVQLPNGHVIVMNQEILLNADDLGKRELEEFERINAEATYDRYLAQDKSNVTRGSKEDDDQYYAFLQSL